MRRAKGILITLILVAAALTAAASYFLYAFYVPDEQAEVLGNIRYTDAEIRRMAMPGFKEHNSLYLRFLRSRIDLTDVPYIDAIEVEYLGPGRVRLHASEEYPVGYLLHDGYRYYFNASGIVTESLEDAPLRREEEKLLQAEREAETEPRDPETENLEAGAAGTNDTGTGDTGTKDTVLQPVPVSESDTSFRPALTDVSQVSGLPDKAYAVGEQIRTENGELFQTLMALGKMVNKLDIRPDEIKIRKDRTLALRYDEILVKIGNDTLLDEKMSRAAAILPQLKGMKGILHLENFNRSTINIVFSENEEDVDIAPAETEETAAGTEEVPADAGELPSETGEVPAETDTAPAETNAASAETNAAPAETNAAPAEAADPGAQQAADNAQEAWPEEIPWDETWDAVWGGGTETEGDGYTEETYEY